MKSGFTFLLCMLFFSSYAQQSETERIQKIKATLPVIEKMYQEYAEKNHFPALAFGLVVDGQLLFSGANGYSEIATSTKATPQSRRREVPRQTFHKMGQNLGAWCSPHRRR